MRIDHFAYQRATRVAGFGFGIQAAIGLTLLVFGLVAPALEGRPSGDTAFLFGAIYVLLGLLVWLSLMVVFHQHKLEGLESLEADELATSRAGSAFEGADDELRVAARRLRLMHRWLMPGASLLLTLLLVATALWMLGRLSKVDDTPDNFLQTSQRGWGISICLAGTLLSFIFSRFVAGMAKQPAWRNLRGGAGYMVGNSLLMLAIGVGLGFRFFEKEGVIATITWAIPIFMMAAAAEIVLNLILNLYRPRVPGDVPRPAFDSSVLGMLAAPDSLVKSINEAVNYQFGFDIASSWGYQLLLRSVVSLVVFGVLVRILLSAMVIVEPHEQAVRLRGGEQIGAIHESGIMWKWPWPLERAEITDVTRVRRIALTAQRIRHSAPDPARQINLWSIKLDDKTDKEIEPFIVASGTFSAEMMPEHPVPSDATEADVSDTYSLVDAEIFLEYRLKPDPSEGLAKHLHFATSRLGRGRGLTWEEALKSLALREITQHLARWDLDDALARRRGDLATELRRSVQDAFDRNETGIEVLAVVIPMLRPAGNLAKPFEDLAFAREERLKQTHQANQIVESGLAALVGDLDMADRIAREIAVMEQLRAEHGLDDPRTLAQQAAIRELFLQADGEVASIILQAQKEREVREISKKTRAQDYRGRLAAFRAAPELYRQREIMRVLAERLALVPKYIIAIDQDRVDVDVELKELNSILTFEPESGNGEGTP